MSCLHPISVRVEKPEYNGSYRGKDGKLHPLTPGTVHYKLVPCNKCAACLARFQMQMSFRLEQEALYGGHASTLFVTLTYDPEHLPLGASLSKDHVQKYVHDLRQKIQRKYKDKDYKLKFYFCGEYGSKYGRPHYHALLYFRRSIDWKLIQESWPNGIVDIRPFLPARAGYVAKYSVKQVGLDYAGRVPPFHLGSNGLGDCFLEGKSLETLQYKLYWRNLSGKLIPLPRYYVEKLGSSVTRYTFDYTKDDPNHPLGVRYRSFTHHNPGYRKVKQVSLSLSLENENRRLIRSGSYERMWLDDVEHLKNLETRLNNLQKQKYNGYYKQTLFEQSRLGLDSSSRPLPGELEDVLY